MPGRIRILLPLLLLLCAARVAAQDASALESIERLAATGRLTDARANLERWNQANPDGAAVAGEVRAHALLLAARLAVDRAAAEAGYLAVALGYPATKHAPEALLRLGQGLLLEAEAGARRDGASRAAGYLERLVSDYPGTPHRAAGVLWLVRAHALAGQGSRACTLARDAVQTGLGDADLEDMLRVEYATHCDDVLPSPDDEPDVSVAAAPAARAGNFTVQSAALAEPARADRLAAALRAAGFDARVVTIDGSRLARVRVGRFATSAEAEATAARMRRANFDALVVGDAARERAR